MNILIHISHPERILMMICLIGICYTVQYILMHLCHERLFLIIIIIIIEGLSLLHCF